MTKTNYKSVKIVENDMGNGATNFDNPQISCVGCEFQEQYSHICKHPNVNGVCLSRLFSIPSWCPLPAKEERK
jgi:hypothetical protein